MTWRWNKINRKEKLKIEKLNLNKVVDYISITKFIGSNKVIIEIQENWFYTWKTKSFI
jgi:hypothetical protein